MTSVLDVIKHYQNSIERYPNDENRLLRCIDKLQHLDVTVRHLEETGVGRTVNALRKDPGNVGVAARALVKEWKNMVAAEERSESEDYNTEPKLYNGNGSEEDSDRIVNQSKLGEVRLHDRSAESQQQFTNGEYSKRKCHSSEEEETDVKRTRYHSSDNEECDNKQNIRVKSESDSSDESESEMSEYSEDEEDVKPRHKKYPEKHSHSSHRDREGKRLDSTSKDKSTVTSAKHAQDHKSASRHSSERHSSKESSNKQKSYPEKDENSEKKHKSSADKSSARHSRSLEKHSSSSEKHSSISEKHHSKDKEDKQKHSSSSHKYESKLDKSISKSHKGDDTRHKSSSEKETLSKEKDKSEERHKHSKDKHRSSDDSKSKHKSSSSKEKSSHSHKDSDEKKHKSRSSSKSTSNENKSKSNDSRENESKSSSSSTLKNSSSSKSNNGSKLPEETPKIKKSQTNSEDSEDGIDCGSGASFAEALGMISPVRPKKKSTIKDISSPLSCSSIDLGPAALLAPTAKLAPLPPLEITALPEISPNYRPRPPPKLLPHFTDEDAMNAVISSKNLRTKVYSGNKTVGKVSTLYELCVQVLQEHIDALEFTGGVPYEILKPVVDKATPEQLERLEEYNHYLIEDTDHLWQKFCEKRFRNKQRQEMETWREMYARCVEDQENKLKKLTANIKMTQDAKNAPVKQTKMAYVDTIVKPPRNIARKQAIHGTARLSSASPAARVTALSTSANVARLGSVRPPAAPSALPGSSLAALQKPKKAPLMQKALQFMRGGRKR